MAIALAEDYENKDLASYIKWLDITRPGSNHTFDYLENFYKNHKHWPYSNKIIKKIESSINDSVNNSKVLSWYNSNPPQTSKGKIDFLEALMDTGVTIKKRKELSISGLIDDL